MTRRKKKTRPIVDEKDLKDFRVVAVLKWDANIELSIMVRATNPDTAYVAYKDRMANINKSATKRGDETFDIYMFKRPREIVEVVDDHFKGIR